MRLTDEQIGAELYALRQTPSDDFAAELDAWAAEGFPSVKQLEKARNSRPSLGERISRRPVLSALAGAAAVVMVVAISVAAYFKERDVSQPLSASSDQSGEVRNQSLQEAAPASGSPLGAPSPAISAAGSRPRNGRAPVQELSAALGLSTDGGMLQDAANGVVEVANRYDGFVDSSDIHVGGSRAHAFFSLRIPSADLRDALDDLSGLGRVVSRDEGSANVTGAYVDAGKAYRDARAKVDSLLVQLRNASSPTQAAAIRQQLVTARQQLAAARDALRGVKQRVTYAPVTVQIRAGDDGGWSIGDAADDAVGVLEAIGGAALITLAVLVPLAALLILAWLGVREFSRRRRDAALDR
jgi:hypothetical protein